MASECVDCAHGQEHGSWTKETLAKRRSHCKVCHAYYPIESRVMHCLRCHINLGSENASDIHGRDCTLDGLREAPTGYGSKWVQDQDRGTF